MSENGPREGTRDLPKRSPEAGLRTPDENSSTGAAYKKLSQSLRRRRAELVELAETGETPSEIAKSYEARHPLEPTVVPHEVEFALREAKTRVSGRSK
jgi:hypothetical protein